MKTPTPWSLLIVVLLFGCPPFGKCETPEESLQIYEKAAKRTEQEISTAGKQAAHKQGIAIIPAILDRSQSWKGEEGLLYMAIILNIPPHETISELEKVLVSKDRHRALWAREFLVEIEMYLSGGHRRVEKILDKYPKKDFPY